MKIWEDFKDPEAKPPRTLKDADKHAVLHFTPYDNIDHLPEGYIEQLDALPYIQRERMLFGRWCGGEGAIFKEFNEKMHVVEPFNVPRSWSRMMAIDFGFDHPRLVATTATDSIYVTAVKGLAKPLEIAK